jgi:soluble lytic murein transglycosylase-like protein
MRSELRWAAAMAVAGLLAAPGPPATRAGASELYRYVDERGVVHFSDKRKHAAFKPIPRPRGFAVLPVARTRRYDRVILDAASAYGVPAAMVKAVIAAESAFDPVARSPKGAMGLMQLMPDTARTLGVHEPYQATENVDGGTRYLRRLHDRYGDWTRTLAAYNAGPGAVDRHQGVPPYQETREYVRRVLSYYRRFHGDFAR